MKVSSEVRIIQKVQIKFFGLLKEPNLLNRGNRFYREEELGAGEAPKYTLYMYKIII